MGQPLVVGQLLPARRGIVRRPPAHDLRQLVRRRLAAVVAPCGRRPRIRTREPTSLRAAVRRRRPAPLRDPLRAGGPMPTRRRRRGPVHCGAACVSHPRRPGPVGTRPPGLTTFGLGPGLGMRNTPTRRSRQLSLVDSLGPAGSRRHGTRGARLIGARRLSGSAGGRRLVMRIRRPAGDIGLRRPALGEGGLEGPGRAVDRVDRRGPKLLLGLGGRSPGIGGPRRLRLAPNDRVPAVDGGRGRGTTLVSRLGKPRRRRLGLRTLRFAGRRQPQPVLLGVPTRECVGEPARTPAVVVLRRMLTSAHPGSPPVIRGRRTAVTGRPA
jgi:hypothetical protein